jgi:hypothetical protein
MTSITPDYYFIVAHLNSLAAELARGMTAREKWRLEQHSRRFERRYSIKHLLPVGQLGAFESVRFYDTGASR